MKERASPLFPAASLLVLTIILQLLLAYPSEARGGIKGQRTSRYPTGRRDLQEELPVPGEPKKQKGLFHAFDQVWVDASGIKKNSATLETKCIKPPKGAGGAGGASSDSTGTGTEEGGAATGTNDTVADSTMNTTADTAGSTTNSTPYVGLLGTRRLQNDTGEVIMGYTDTNGTATPTGTVITTGDAGGAGGTGGAGYSSGKGSSKSGAGGAGGAAGTGASSGKAGTSKAGAGGAGGAGGLPYCQDDGMGGAGGAGGGYGKSGRSSKGTGTGTGSGSGADSGGAGSGGAGSPTAGGTGESPATSPTAAGVGGSPVLTPTTDGTGGISAPTASGTGGSPGATPTATGSPIATPTSDGSGESPAATPTAIGSPIATPTASGTGDNPVALPTTTGGASGESPTLSVCEAFANGNAPTTGVSKQYQVGMALTIDQTFQEEPILGNITTVLNKNVAPFLLGCSNSRQLRRYLQTTELTNIIFSQPTRDQSGSCTATVADSLCVPTIIRSDVFYNGDSPVGFEDLIRQAILMQSFNISGLRGLGNLVVTDESGASAPAAAPGDEDGNRDPDVSSINSAADDKSVNPGAFVAAGLAGLTLVLLALFVARRRRYSDESLSKHRELQEDEDLGLTTDDDDTLQQREVIPQRKSYVVGEGDSVQSWDSRKSPGNDGQEVYAASSPVMDYQHSPHHMCSSPNCELCEQKRQQGTRFIMADSGNDQHVSFIPSEENDRDYEHDDTVDL